MKIKFLSGPRAGQIDHAPISQETDLLVKAGIIEVIPYKDFRERLAESMPKPATLTASWGVRRITVASHEQNPRCAVIVKTMSNGDESIYDAPPKDCPPATSTRFHRELSLDAQMAQDMQHARKVAASQG